MNDILIVAQAMPYPSGPTQGRMGIDGGAWFGRGAYKSAYFYGYIRRVALLRIPQGETSSSRIVGLKTATNEDGSYQIVLLSNSGARYDQSGRKQMTVGLTNLQEVHAVQIGNTSNYYLDMPQILTDGNGSFPYKNYGYSGTANTNSYFYSNLTNGQMGNNQLLDLSDVSIPDDWSNTNKSDIERYISNIGSASMAGKYISTDETTSVKFGINTELSSYLSGYNIDAIDADARLFDENNKCDPTIGISGDVSTFLNEGYEMGKSSAASFLPETYNYQSFNENPTYVPRQNYAGYIRYFNLHITSSKTKALAYLNDGTIPDDDEYEERDVDKPSPTPPTPPEPSESQVGNDEDNIPEHTSRKTFSANTGNCLTGLNWYHLHRSILEQFINWFWNDSVSDWSTVFFNAITGLYGNLQNAVISIKKMHVPVNYWRGGWSETGSIKLGRYSCPVSASNYSQLITAPISQLVHVGGLSIYESDDLYNFINYEPYSSASLYMPYIGIVPLNMRYLRGKRSDGTPRTLNVAAGADFMTGEIVYRVQMDDADVSYYQGKCSEDVPFSLQSGIDIASNVVNAVGNVSAGVALGGVTSAVSILGQDISSPTNNNVSVTSNLNRYCGSKLALIIQRQQYYKLYDTSQGLTKGTYAHTSGYKYNCIHRFSNGDGYVEFEEPHIDDWETSPTSDEIDECYRLMSEGVIL